MRVNKPTNPHTNDASALAPEARSTNMPVRYGTALIASLLLGDAITFNSGMYSDLAFHVIVIALGLVVWNFIDGLRAPSNLLGDARKVAPLIVAALFGMLWAGYNDPILFYPKEPWKYGRLAQLAMAALLATYVPSIAADLRESRWVRHARFALVGLAVLAAGLDVIRVSPSPYIDVWTIQMAGADALEHGKNPFVGITVGDTGPGRAPVPYVYPPTILYFGMLGRLIGHDTRYANLLAIIGAGVLLRMVSRRGRYALPAMVEDAPALAVWFMPKLFFILEQAWIDPIQVMLMAAGSWAFAAQRHRWSGALFGVAIASKQSMFWLIPLVSLTLGVGLWGVVFMAGTAALLTAPFMLWNFRALKYANFDFLKDLPARDDALAFAAWYRKKFGSVFPDGPVSFLSSGLITAASAVRAKLWTKGKLFVGAPASLAGFGRALACLYCIFFFFNKWAFANYYFLMASLCALSAATALHEE